MFLTTITWMDGAEDSWKTQHRPTTDNGLLRMHLRKSNPNWESPLVAVPLENVRRFVIEDGH